MKDRYANVSSRIQPLALDIKFIMGKRYVWFDFYKKIVIISNLTLFSSKGITPCELNCNNTNRLYHYRMNITPYSNFIVSVISNFV